MKSHKTSIKSNSISKRFSYALITIITILLLLFSFSLIAYDGSKLNSELETRLDNVMKLAKISLPTPLWNLDYDVVSDFIEALFQDNSIVFAEVVFGDEVITHRVREEVEPLNLEALSNSPDYFYKSTEIYFEGNRVGTITMIMSRNVVRQELFKVGAMILVLTLAMIVATGFTSLLITQKYITAPLAKLQESAESIARGDLDTPIDRKNEDEIGMLAQNFDIMRESIRSLFHEVTESNRKIEAYSLNLEQQVKERTRELAQSLEEMQALGKVGQIINSTLDIESVMKRVVRHAVELSDTEGGAYLEFDSRSQLFETKIHYGVNDSFAEALKYAIIRRGDNTAIGRAAETANPVQIEDIHREDGYPLAFVRDEGYLALLAVPVMRENQILGGLVVLRKASGGFSKQTVNLLQAFGDQSALAIHNARLFLEVEEKGRDLELADKHKSEFLANMSHELRTPLNAILGYTELILDNIYGEVPEKIEGVLVRLEQNGRHLLNLINDVLDLSRIEAGRLTLSLNEYSLTALIHNVCQSVESLLSEKNLQLKVNLSDDLPIGVGDEQRISQVVMNLLGNAIKFTEEGYISIAAYTENSLFLVSVSDTGCGMSKRDQEKIFEEFRQVDSSSTREKGGTGLGLAIARKIVGLHGGDIWVESTQDEGSTFSFTLPVKVTRNKE